ncbi:MAG TPA: hypothetical protein VMH30_04810 [Verrucomicrobiae bacterium]|nr:hypothetical protein [Verrucomicrobiae bacterium]
MKSSAFLTLLCAGLLAGCASHRQNQSFQTPAPTPPQPVVTPAISPAARVVSYNSVGRFVVLSFPVGEMPKIGETLFLYRAGLKVGDVQITGPQRNTDIVADLTSGEARVGDEVREQ